MNSTFYGDSEIRHDGASHHAENDGDPSVNDTLEKEIANVDHHAENDGAPSAGATPEKETANADRHAVGEDNRAENNGAPNVGVTLEKEAANADCHAEGDGNSAARQGEQKSPYNNPTEDGDELYSSLLEQLEAVTKINHPATQNIRDILVDLAKENRRLRKLATVLEERPGKEAKAKTKRKPKNPKEKEKSNDRGNTAAADMSAEMMDIKISLKTKWRRLEADDLKEIAKIKYEGRLDSEERTTAVKIGRQSKYVEALQILASQLISKRVDNRQSTVLVGAEDADNFLEVARAISSPNSVCQLAEQVKLLLKDEEKNSSLIPAEELHIDCYDETGVLNGLGTIVQYGLDVVRMETGDATRRVRYRFNCIKIAKHYEEEQAKEKETRKAGPREKGEKGERGKGIASKVKKDIIGLVKCTTSCLDRWIKLGKALTHLVDDFGIGILGLIPNKISDFRLLSLPAGSFDLITRAINYLHPNMGDLSALVEKYLLQHLMQRSSPRAATLQSMLSEAKELNLQIPLKRVISSMEVLTEADSSSPGGGQLDRILESAGGEGDNSVGDSTLGGNTGGTVNDDPIEDTQIGNGGSAKRRRKANVSNPRKRAKVTGGKDSSGT
ncbi:MAG: hypothetical protein M1813_004744 [Trichoglossum hirsutum]|nr:MAG: hypothetical protein M1813_004744 [Trichoglossum hirsutum]